MKRAERAASNSEVRAASRTHHPQVIQKEGVRRDLFRELARREEGGATSEVALKERAEGIASLW